MNHTNIVKQAWRTAWHYRVLWIIGMVLALTTFSWGSLMLYDGDWENYDRGIKITQLDNETFGEALRRTVREEIQETRRDIAQADRELNELFAELGISLKSNVLLYGVLLASLVLVLYVVGKVARYVAEVSLIRAVDNYAQTGERRTLGKALRMGWSVRAWRLFLINLLVDLPFALFGVAMFAAILAPIFLWVNGSEVMIFYFALLTGGLSMVAIALLIVGAAVLSLVKILAWRACASEGLGVWASIGRGFATFGKHVKNVGVTWLITVLARWGWRLVMVPVVVALIGGGLIVGGLPATVVGAATSLVTEGDMPVFLALAVGIPIFVAVQAAPLALLESILQVFVSSLWTLTYRDLRRIQGLEPVHAKGKSGLETAPAVS